MAFEHDCIHALKDLNVIIRPFRPTLVPSKTINGYFDNIKNENSYLIFNDGISNFEESDLWFILSDHVYNPLPPHRPYGIMVYDYVQKYHPDILNKDGWQIFQKRAQVTCDARFVITTTEQTRRDVINFAGADPRLVHRFPIEFDPPLHLINGDSQIDHHLLKPGSYVIWPTMLSSHENHLQILEELDLFLSQSAIKILIAGFGTESMNPKNNHSIIHHPYIVKIREKIARSTNLQNNLIIRGFIPDTEYASLLKNAACLLHTSSGDNGAYAPIEAAWLGVHSICNDYPAMQEFSAQFNVPCVWFNPNSRHSLCKALTEALKQKSTYRTLLPSQDALRAYSFDQLAAEYWQRFISIATGTLINEKV